MMAAVNRFSPLNASSNHAIATLLGLQQGQRPPNYDSSVTGASAFRDLGAVTRAPVPGDRPMQHAERQRETKRLRAQPAGRIAPRATWQQLALTIGPALVVMLADTEAGSVIAAAQSGA